MDTFSGVTAASLSIGKLGVQIAEQASIVGKYASGTKQASASTAELAKQASKTGKAVEDQSKAISEAFEKTKKWNTALYNLGEYMARWGKSGSAYFTGLAGGYADSASTIVTYNNLAGDSAAALMSGIRTANWIRTTALTIGSISIDKLTIHFTIQSGSSTTAAAAATIKIYNLASASTAQLLAQQGIILDTTAAYAQYAAGIGTTASALTEQQQQAALLYALMEQGQTLTDAAGNSQYALGTSMEQAEASVASMNFAMAEATAGPMQLPGTPVLSASC